MSDPFNVTINELKRAGLIYSIVQGSKHLKIKVDGLPMIVCSKSPSDRRSEIKARSLVRRLIKRSTKECG